MFVKSNRTKMNDFGNHHILLIYRLFGVRFSLVVNYLVLLACHRLYAVCSCKSIWATHRYCHTPTYTSPT
ncbi:hypothetical protein XENTR_v10001416 [Xenopus tropicalis]|nr:hypothetical protein XENTR_v10001416 [Xenopus tropicalis]